MGRDLFSSSSLDDAIVIKQIYIIAREMLGSNYKFIEYGHYQ